MKCPILETTRPISDKVYRIQFISKLFQQALDGQSQQRPATRPIRMIGEHQIATVSLCNLATQG